LADGFESLLHKSQSSALMNDFNSRGPTDSLCWQLKQSIIIIIISGIGIARLCILKKLTELGR